MVRIWPAARVNVPHPGLIGREQTVKFSRVNLKTWLKEVIYIPQPAV